MIPSTPDVVTTYDNFSITYDGDTVDLPKPQLLDTKTQQLTQIHRANVGLKQCLFKSADWYGLRIFDYEFRNLTKVLKDEAVTLLTDAAGHSISVKDYLSKVRTMYIIQVRPVEEVKNNECSYAFGLTLQEVF